jgi:hypothetical protein
LPSTGFPPFSSVSLFLYISTNFFHTHSPPPHIFFKKCYGKLLLIHLLGASDQVARGSEYCSEIILKGPLARLSPGTDFLVSFSEDEVLWSAHGIFGIS